MDYRKTMGLLMPVTERVFIIGQHGAGKGLLARTLAHKLNWRFIDADLGIESHVGIDLTEILGRDGLKSYINCQEKILQSLLHKKKIVVATDGLVLGSERCKGLLKSEYVVHLKVDIITQLERASTSPKPLLNENKLGDLLNNLHLERDKNYDAAANYSLSSDDNELDEHVDSIIDVINMEEEELLHAEASYQSYEQRYLHFKNHKPVQLSKRQTYCLKLLATGKSSKAIAREMNISHRTVEEHVSNMMRLLGCDSSRELITVYHNKK